MLAYPHACPDVSDYGIKGDFVKNIATVPCLPDTPSRTNLKNLEKKNGKE